MKGGRDGIGSPEDLSATQITGLADFGAGDYRDGLSVLLDSCARDAGFTPLGERVFRAFLRGALVARLLSEAGWAGQPGYARVGLHGRDFANVLSRTMP